MAAGMRALAPRQGSNSWGFNEAAAEWPREFVLISLSLR